MAFETVPPHIKKMTVVTELQAGDRQVLSLSDPSAREAAFEQMCRLNPEVRMEQNAEGEIYRDGACGPGERRQ
jgi:hypothetical protein